MRHALYRSTALLLIVFVAGVVGCARKDAQSETTAGPPVARPAPPAKKEPITVFAGAASMPALQVLGPLYQEKTGTKVDITSGGSGSVLTQFSQEHYGDVYVPGSDDFMDRAETEGAVVADTRTVLVYLIPEICVEKGNPLDIDELEDLARPGLRVVIGEPQSVCLGEIGKWMLTEAGLWDRVEPQIVSYGESCEKVLNTLLLGEADVVIGWDQFARQNPDEVESIAVPVELSRTRNIPAAVITWSAQPDAAKEFIAFLASEEAKRVWADTGYSLEPPSRE